jgi:hypothetical protein
MIRSTSGSRPGPRSCPVCPSSSAGAPAPAPFDDQEHLRQPIEPRNLPGVPVAVARGAAQRLASGPPVIVRDTRITTSPKTA